MSPEKQRIAIADACGWSRYSALSTHGWIEGEPETDGPIPDYLNDLNACSELINYMESLGWACVLVAQNGARCCTFTDGIDYKVIGDKFETAICEAFLRTLNLWTES